MGRVIEAEDRIDLGFGIGKGSLEKQVERLEVGLCLLKELERWYLGKGFLQGKHLELSSFGHFEFLSL